VQRIVGRRGNKVNAVGVRHAARRYNYARPFKRYNGITVAMFTLSSLPVGRTRNMQCPEEDPPREYSEIGMREPEVLRTA